MGRPVHYAAATRNGLAFDCYIAEVRMWGDALRVVEAEYDAIRRTDPNTLVRQKQPAYPKPRCHTDLGNVTCQECWRQIAAMAARILPPGARR